MASRTWLLSSVSARSMSSKSSRRASLNGRSTAPCTQHESSQGGQQQAKLPQDCCYLRGPRPCLLAEVCTRQQNAEDPPRGKDGFINLWSSCSANSRGPLQVLLVKDPSPPSNPWIPKESTDYAIRTVALCSRTPPNPPPLLSAPLLRPHLAFPPCCGRRLLLFVGAVLGEGRGQPARAPLHHDKGVHPPAREGVPLRKGEDAPAVVVVQRGLQVEEEGVDRVAALALHNGLHTTHRRGSGKGRRSEQRMQDGSMTSERRRHAHAVRCYSSQPALTMVQTGVTEEAALTRVLNAGRERMCACGNYNHSRPAQHGSRCDSMVETWRWPQLLLQCGCLSTWPGPCQLARTSHGRAAPMTPHLATVCRCSAHLFKGAAVVEHKEGDGVNDALLEGVARHGHHHVREARGRGLHGRGQQAQLSGCSSRLGDGLRRSAGDAHRRGDGRPLDMRQARGT
jgi:hypothetical protein